MKISPVQLVESNPMRVSVELNQEASSDSDFDGGRLDIGLEHLAQITKYPHLDKDTNCYTYFGVLGVRNSEEDIAFLPYKFEVLVTARFTVDADFFKENVDDNATRYGFTMMYGQIREIVTLLTSRMRRGELVLPTMSFMDATFAESSMTPDDDVTE